MLSLITLVLAGEPAEYSEAIYRSLSLRDGVSCSSLGSGAEVRDSLIQLTAPDLMPGVVPMRAVGCLIEQFGEDPVVQDRLVEWVVDPARYGQGLLIVGSVDALGMGAVRVVEAALAVGDAAWKERYRVRLARSMREDVRAVVARP